jgi:hypothetical protein
MQYNEFNVGNAMETGETSYCTETHCDVFLASLFFFSDLSLRSFHLASFCSCCSFLFCFTFRPISYAVFLSALILFHHHLRSRIGIAMAEAADFRVVSTACFGLPTSNSRRRHMNNQKVMI